MKIEWIHPQDFLLYFFTVLYCTWKPRNRFICVYQLYISITVTLGLIQTGPKHQLPFKSWRFFTSQGQLTNALKTKQNISKVSMNFFPINSTQLGDFSWILACCSGMHLKLKVRVSDPNYDLSFIWVNSRLLGFTPVSLKSDQEWTNQCQQKQNRDFYIYTSRKRERERRKKEREKQKVLDLAQL